MRTITRTIAVVLAAAAALVTSIGVAAAQSDVAGTGAIWAEGTGQAELAVRHGTVGMRVTGDVTIVGPAGLDVVIDGRPAPRSADSSETIIVLDDFTGRIAVRGSGYTVSVEGSVALHGRGSGSASFAGQGWWKTLSKRGLWPADGPHAAVEFAADAA